MPHLTRHIAVLVLLAAALLALQAGSATAGVVFTVDSTVDAVDATPGDGVCASAANGCTVRAATQEANALASSQSIVIPAGTYTISIPGSGEDDGATGDFDISDDVSISGADIDDTIIDGASLDRVFDVTGGTVEIKDLTIQHGFEDTVWGGGAIRNLSNLTLLRTNVILNWSVAGVGGVLNRSTMTIAQSTIDSNHSEEAVGGVFTDGQMEIVDSTISNNVAEGFDGGVTNHDSLSILNSTISGNSASLGGGLKTSVEGTTEVTNTTIANNEGGDNGGIRTVGGATVMLTNTIVASNSGDNCFTGDFALSFLTSLGHNLASDGTCGLSAAGDLPNTNPLIGPLLFNGGFTNTHTLLQGSPAIDAGDAALCPNQDQRGTARPQGPVCDIGAYEATGDEPPPANLQAPWGDNNCSGSADPVDSLLTLRFDAGLSANTGSCPDMGQVVDVAGASPHVWGDVDCGGDVTPVDSLKLLRFDAGLSVAQEANCPLVGSNVIITLT